MSTGLLALLDDIAALTKVAASSLDDVAANAAKAGTKAAGIVIDDTAVTPRYVVGLGADRELPVIGRIALSSLRNKLLYLLPGALVLSFFAPWGIPPLLLIGGAFLSLEGFHKAADLVAGHSSDSGPEGSEADRVASAVRTDLILSAEIMAIALGAVAGSPPLTQAIALVAVGIGMTFGVYGLVALIVKADDAGLALSQSSNSVLRSLGRALVQGMPPFLKVLSLVGMAAMLWVGGGIVIHSLAQIGWHTPEHWLHQATHSVPPAFTWPFQALLSALAGLALGGLLTAAQRAGARFR